MTEERRCEICGKPVNHLTGLYFGYDPGVQETRTVGRCCRDMIEDEEQLRRPVPAPPALEEDHGK